VPALSQLSNVVIRCGIARIKGSKESNNLLISGLSGSLSANELPEKSWKQAMNILPLKILALGA